MAVSPKTKDKPQHPGANSADLLNGDNKAPASKPNASPLLTSVHDLTDKTLFFISTASNETLGACVVGLCASTYLVLGRLGLVAIGVVGGIVLHATWEAQDASVGQASGDRARRKKELGIEVTKRVLDWRDSKRTQSDEGALGVENVDASRASAALNYNAFRPATRRALENLSDAVIENYVSWWYRPLLPQDPSFPDSCRDAWASFVLSFSNRLARKRPGDVFLDFFSNSASIIVVFFQELSTALQSFARQNPKDSVSAYLTSQPDSNLANVLSREQQERKLNTIAADILESFLQPDLYKSTVLVTCSKPEFINEWIVYLLEDEKEQPALLTVLDDTMEENVGVSHDVDQKKKEENLGHKRRISKADEAMQEAMEHAKYINSLIAAQEEAERQQTSVSADTDMSNLSTASTTEGFPTPTSSDADSARRSDENLNAPLAENTSTFTSFDQTLAPKQSVSDLSSPAVSEAPLILTLKNASINIFDEGEPETKLRQKPTNDYLVQIEPASSRFSGWMTVRRYEDFEKLHEVLRRLAVIAGAAEFTQKYPLLPNWKSQKRGTLQRDLEAYLLLALRFEALAESDGVKRFLDKEAGLKKTPASKNVLGFQNPAALEAVGKGFINVLGQAPKGIAGGGKAVLDGVTGVFGAGVAGQKKDLQPAPRPEKSPSAPKVSRSSLTTATSITGSGSDVSYAPTLPARPTRASSEARRRSNSSSRSQTVGSHESLRLPPPPSEISDDYAEKAQASPRPELPPRVISDKLPTSPKTPPRLASSGPDGSELPSSSTGSGNDAPLMEDETRVVVELMFAVITELYSLSSAWAIRLSLLAAARSFLLRPNNPQIESVRALLQGSIIDSNTSDEGLATHINKLRENALPTEEELKKWPAEPTAEEKEKLRIKARKLLTERGMPAALTGVMGAAATSEALGRLFDCLQVAEIARGFIFAIMLQGVRATTQ